MPDWFCCGATPAHNVDELLSLSLCAKNLELAEKVEGDLAVACAACFSRLKTTQHILGGNDDQAQAGGKSHRRPGATGRQVKHLLEILAKDLGLERLAAAVKKPLAGLKVACYYGCLLTRPAEVPNWTALRSPDHHGERAVGRPAPRRSPGATAWSAAAPTSPCRVPASSSQLTNAILASAKAAGADCIMVACPLCHGNLDIRQKEIEEDVQRRTYNLPVFYLTQLVGSPCGLPDSEAGLDSMIVNPRPLLKEKQLL